MKQEKLMRRALSRIRSASRGGSRRSFRGYQKTRSRSLPDARSVGGLLMCQINFVR